MRKKPNGRTYDRYKQNIVKVKLIKEYVKQKKRRKEENWANQ